MAEYIVTVRYVRKEIRDESPEQRKRFFDALSTVYRVGTDEGQVLYGKKYKSIEYFVAQHLKGAVSGRVVSMTFVAMTFGSIVPYHKQPQVLLLTRRNEKSATETLTRIRNLGGYHV